MTSPQRVSARSSHIDFSTTHATSYCIPLWLRDEQIKLACARPGLGRIEESSVKRIDPIAVVCFGPSLQSTWEEIKGFSYILSCSGAHKFLLERGIVPTWHVEVDPRAHKVELLGPPHPDVIYLPASTCHPKYFDHLEGFQVKLWHVFSSEADAIRTLPRGEWALTGGPDVGLRAMLIARFLGFTTLHVFGMDGCVSTEGTHATSHPNPPVNILPCDYEGVTYQTTPALLECAKSIPHEMDMMKDVTATFHGTGLVQAMMARYVPNPPPTSTIGIAHPELISQDFKRLNVRLHRDSLEYGVGGGKHAETVKKLAALLQRNGHMPSVLDYGCGKGYLAKALPFPIWEYDPAIPGKEELPRPADLVVCTDVLEHIEPGKLLYVLDDLRRCVKQMGFFTIHTGPAAKSYADGRNTHLTQQPRSWWEPQISRFFHIGKVYEAGPELWILVIPRQSIEGLSALRAEHAMLIQEGL